MDRGRGERGTDIVREEMVGLKKKKAEPIKVRPMVLLPTEKASLGIVIKHPTRAHQILLTRVQKRSCPCNIVQTFLPLPLSTY